MIETWRLKFELDLKRAQNRFCAAKKLSNEAESNLFIGTFDNNNNKFWTK